ncbi:MAG: hypothetical protein QM619_12375 [Micropruina sp.]
MKCLEGLNRGVALGERVENRETGGGIRRASDRDRASDLSTHAWRLGDQRIVELCDQRPGRVVRGGARRVGGLNRGPQLVGAWSFVPGMPEAAVQGVVAAADEVVIPVVGILLVQRHQDVARYPGGCAGVQKQQECREPANLMVLRTFPQEKLAGVDGVLGDTDGCFLLVIMVKRVMAGVPSVCRPSDRARLQGGRTNGRVEDIESGKMTSRRAAARMRGTGSAVSRSAISSVCPWHRA